MARKLLSFKRVVCIISILPLLASSCAAPKTERNAPAPENVHRIYVVHNNWHAAFVVRASESVAAQIPEVAHFPGAEYLEISWGDADFFPAPEAGIGLALKAAFWSSGSVLHVVGFGGSIKNTYRGAEIIEIELSESEFQRIIRFVSAEFARESPMQAAVPRPGLFSQSRFYPARSKFNVLRNCNTWVAEAFDAADLPVNPAYVLTAGSVARQIKQFGTVR